MQLTDLGGEVEDFLAQCNIDERAMDAFRKCTPEVQQAVLDRGSLEGARNPSSALLGRVKDAQAACSGSGSGGRGGGGGGGGGRGERDNGRNQVPQVDPSLIEHFLQEANVDDRAAEALRTASPQAQQYVLDRGSLQDARNPSSALCGRLKEGASGRMVVFQEVDLFIRDNNLDEKAAEALRTATPMAQRFCLDRGSLQDARNPNSAVIGRLRDARETPPPGPPPQYGGGGAPHYGAIVSHYGGGAPHYGGGAPHYGGGMGNGMRPMQAPPPHFGGGGGASPAVFQLAKKAVEMFLESSGADERACDALRTADPETQLAVLDRGGLQGSNNPSSALLGRLKQAQKGGGRGGGGYRPY